MNIDQEARAEAEKRWPRPSSAWGSTSLAERAGFINGYIAGASRPASPARETVTEEMVELGARALYEDTRARWVARERRPFPRWEQFGDKDHCRRDARIVLEAALAEKGYDR